MTCDSGVRIHVASALLLQGEGRACGLADSIRCLSFPEGNE
jgi:hypothetical protein